MVQNRQDVQSLKQENEMLKKQLMRYKGTLRIPLCEICGKLIYSEETRIILKKCERTPNYSEAVLEHIHIKCWDKIKKQFKYKLENLK